jgi:dipeptide/tripeptide permease
MMFVVNPRYSSMQLQTANAVKQKNNVYNAIFGFKIPVYTFNSYNPFFIIVKVYAVDSQGRSGPITSKTITQTGKTVLIIS